MTIGLASLQGLERWAKDLPVSLTLVFALGSLVFLALGALGFLSVVPFFAAIFQLIVVGMTTFVAATWLTGRKTIGGVVSVAVGVLFVLFSLGLFWIVIGYVS